MLVPWSGADDADKIFWTFQRDKWATKKNPPTFYYTACFIIIPT